MSPIQQMLLGVGAVATKTYVDDVFSTFLYKGNNNSNPDTQSINNGIDLSTEGGLVWIKSRTNTYNHILQDTANGTGKWLQSNTNGGTTNTSQYITSFNANGFSLGTDNDINNSSQDFSSWSFRKSPGFFDVVTYSGDGTDNRSISHSLGCSVGMMIIKVTNHADDWLVWHKDLEDEKALTLNTNNEAFGYSSSIPSDPTSSSFTVSSNVKANASGKTYVCYLFAGGGEGYNSVNFDAATESLSATSSDYAFGTGDFTVEAWIKPTNLSGVTYQNIIDTRGTTENSTTGFSIGVTASSLYFYSHGFNITSAANTIAENQWYHIAVVNNGGTIKAYVNGVEKGSFSVTNQNFTNTTFRIANVDTSAGQNFIGLISNVRVVKGTAVYTSAFTSPTAPLTNITNTKLLCCNGDSTTSSTVASGTLSASGSPNITYTTPFISPDAVFGESGSESVIKCGSYVGNGSSTGPEINLGWEPSFILTKRATGGTGTWYMADSMRGLTASPNGIDALLAPNSNAAEYTSDYFYGPTSTGFKIESSSDNFNQNGDTYIFLAIRRSDGYCGKPFELGTSVFSLNSGANSGAPLFDSTHVVDYQFVRNINSTADWETGARIIGSKQVYLNTTGAETNIDPNGWKYDYMNGWHTNASGISNYMCWMWKRHAGFDLVCYEGNSTAGHQISHSLNKTIEMIWIKRRSPAEQWVVGHKGLDGGNQPWTHFLTLNTDAAEADADNIFNDTAPVATHFTLGDGNYTNNDGDNYIAMLFCSVSGISAVGSYTGTSSSNPQTVGFLPRIVIVKRTDGTGDWNLIWAFNTGTYSDSDYRLRLNKTNASTNDSNWMDVTSTTFDPGVGLGNSVINSNGKDYIYYAHA